MNENQRARPETSRLQADWSRLAGAPIHVELREATAHADARPEESALSRFRGQIAPELAQRFLTPPAGLLPTRASQWSLSRVCLLAVLERLPADTHRPLLSLSHCALGSIAAGALAPALSGIGVDVEDRARKISPAVAARILSADETALGLLPLDAWVIKEACFKATPGNDGHVVADYAIRSLARGRGEATCAKTPDLAFRFGLTEVGGLRVAFACAQKL